MSDLDVSGGQLGFQLPHGHAVHFKARRGDLQARHGVEQIANGFGAVGWSFAGASLAFSASKASPKSRN